MNEDIDKKMKKTIKLLRCVSAVLLIFVVLSLTLTYGWFYYGRNAIGIEEISNPTAIYINSGNEESHIYIDLGSIDVSKGTYKDVVFCIKGMNVRYKIQLAYTTNNQFSFDLFNASLYEGNSFDPDDYFTTVQYFTHPYSGDPETQHYYVENGDSTPLAGTYLNRVLVNGEYLGASSGTEYTTTYGTYTVVEPHAIPIYWQMDDAINHPGLDPFTDYFVLRIKWDTTLVNNKETDIIYITATNAS